MKDNFTKIILLGILICLIVIAFKPSPYFSLSPDIDINNGESIVQLAPDRLAVVDNRNDSGLRGTVLVYDFNEETKTFDFTGYFNYADYFSNPQKYGITTD